MSWKTFFQIAALIAFYLALNYVVQQYSIGKMRAESDARVANILGH